MMQLNTGIYEIRNTTNGKRYVGSAKSLDTRFRSHLNNLRKDKHPNRYLQFAWNKYGERVFEFKAILYCSKRNLLFYEQRALDTYNALYNLAPTAGSQLGWIMPDETKANISKAKKGKSIVMPPFTDKHRENLSKANTGRKHSPETIQKMKKSHEIPWNKGKFSSDETKQKIAQSKKGCTPWNKGKTGVYSPETLAKISAASTGRVFSPETRAEMSRTRKGKPNGFQGKHHTPETLEKISAAGKGRVQSLATRQKRAASIKKWHAERKAKSKPIRIPYL